MILFYDTETTGLTNFRQGPEHPSQPHIVQLAAILINDGEEAETLNVIVRPDGYEIPEEASNVHGITQDRAFSDGIPLWKAVWQFDRMLMQASRRVAHNRAFDDLVLRSAYHRLRMPNPLNEVDSFCTMEATTPICKLPGRYGSYKWPKLEEAYRHFFSKDMEGAHDALVDVRACAEVYFAMTPCGMETL